MSEPDAIQDFDRTCCNRKIAKAYGRRAKREQHKRPHGTSVKIRSIMKFKGENEKNLDFSRFFDTVLFIPQNLVGEGGFGPPKSLTTDLQSAPFGHLGTLPYSV